MADRNSQAPEEHMGPTTRPAEQPKGPGEAILLGALASGVNVMSASLPHTTHTATLVSELSLFSPMIVQKPTWTTLKIVLLGLGASLLLLLHVCRSSPELSQHVVVLIVITGTLFVLLKWYGAFSSPTHSN